MEAVDCEMAIIVAPWARGLKMLKAGTVDFMVNMSKTSAREQHYYFVGPHRIENIRLLAKKGALEPITTLTQLTASKAYVMRQKGSYFGKRFEQIVSAKAVKLLELPNNNIRMDLLLKGRIDGFLADENYINSVIKDIPQSDQLLIHPLVINSNPVYYAFSKASVSAAQIDKIRQAFRVLSKTKAYQAIAL